MCHSRWALERASLFLTLFQLINGFSGVRLGCLSPFHFRYCRSVKAGFITSEFTWNSSDISCQGWIKRRWWLYRSSTRCACGRVWSALRWEQGSFITFQASLCSGNASNRNRRAALDRQVPGPVPNSGEHTCTIYMAHFHCKCCKHLWFCVWSRNTFAGECCSCIKLSFSSLFSTFFPFSYHVSLTLIMDDFLHIVSIISVKSV